MSELYIANPDTGKVSRVDFPSKDYNAVQNACKYLWSSIMHLIDPATGKSEQYVIDAVNNVTIQ